MGKIILCTKCNGKGKWVKKELEDYHNNIYKTVGVEVCGGCNGTGRMVESISYTPYVEYEFNGEQHD